MSAGVENKSAQYPPHSRGADMHVIASHARDILPITLNHEPVAKNPVRTAQHDIVEEALSGREDRKTALSERFQGDFAQGLTRERLLYEYTTAQLGRQFALKEKLMYGKELDFFVHGAGMEIAQILLQRHMDNNDAYVPYYRGQIPDLYRGGTVEEQFAQDGHKEGDSHSKGRQLAGHVGSEERGIIPAISMTGPQVLEAVGIGIALNDRRHRPDSSIRRRFSKPDAIALTELGEATFAEGEVMEGINEAVKEQAATVIVGYNNLGGISMGLEDSSVNGDPILYARSFADKGLHLVEVSGTDLDELALAARDVVEHTRKERGPSLLMVNDLYRVTDHTSSSNQDWFTPPDELERRKQLDMLPAYRQKLIDMGVATDEEIAAIDAATKQKVEDAAEEVFSRPDENPERVYEDVYAPAFSYGPQRISELSFVPPVDRLGSSREKGVQYADQKKKHGTQLTGRMQVNLTLAEEMRRDPTIVVYGEDVAQFGAQDWRNLPGYFEQRIKQKKDSLTKEQIVLARDALEVIMDGKGFEASSEALAAFAHIMDGKGGVFKRTQFLDVLFGKERSRNHPIREATIIGKGTGLAIAGELPVVEIQFDPYKAPAQQQLQYYLSTLRWRGGGQCDSGIVVRIQGMNRVGGDGISKAGGVGGIGHGEADITSLLVPGLRHFIPGDVEEMGTGLREAIRVARVHREPVIVWEPINFNMAYGYYQGPEAHTPLGEAEVRRSGQDLLLITWSNNVRIAEAVANTLGQKDFHGRKMDVGVLNARGLTDHFDWETAIREIQKANKVMVFEAGRRDGGALTQQINQQLPEYFDGHPAVWYPARYLPMPAGDLNEAFVVPQYRDVLEKAEALIRY